jgi:hypothetical protein
MAAVSLEISVLVAVIAIFQMMLLKDFPYI